VFNVFQSKIKLKIVVLMLLTFIGQASAASIFSVCQMEMQAQTHTNPTSTNQTHGNLPQTQSMDHSSHLMDMQMADSSLINDMDCCQSDGGCSMSGCISLALFSVQEASTPSFSTASILLDFDVSIIQIPSSLYRPPILS